MKVFLCEDAGWLLSKKAFSIYASCMYTKSYDDYKKQMKRYIDEPFIKVFVCEMNGKIAGVLVLDQTTAVPKIVGIAVSLDHRGQGVGKYMIKHIVALEHLESLEVQTDEEAIGFYRKCGFTDKKELVKFSDGVSVRYNCEWRKNKFV